MKEGGTPSLGSSFIASSLLFKQKFSEFFDLLSVFLPILLKTVKCHILVEIQVEIGNTTTTTSSNNNNNIHFKTQIYCLAHD